MDDRNRRFSGMLQAAIARLEGQSPEEISRRSGISWDGHALYLESLGISVAISYPEYRISPELDPWHALSLLHDLANADAFPLTGRQISFAQYRDGMVRGGGFDRDVEKIAETQLALLSPSELERRCLNLGAALLPSNADLCAEFSFAPNVPIWLKIWFADDEFPASARMLMDASAEHYLSIEDAVTVGSLILSRLVNP